MNSENKNPKKLKMTSGTTLPREIDLTAIIEALYKEVAIENKMDYSFQDMKREIENLISQLTGKEQIQLLTESLFLNTISYENQLMENILKKLEPQK